METDGTVIVCASGRKVQIDTMLAAGGQGFVYKGRHLATKEAGAVKLFRDQYQTADTAVRINFLLNSRLHEACPIIVCPSEKITQKTRLGHFSSWAPGEALTDFLANAQTTLTDRLQLAIALARGVATLHSKQIAHGDLHGDNVKVHRQGTVLRPYLIDNDNFAAPGVPPPTHAGQLLYIAPELSCALKQKRVAAPNIATDRFSFGVMMHEILLLFHPANGCDTTPEQFDQAMAMGKWIHDPAGPCRATRTGGYPPTILNSGIQNLLRRSLSLTPGQRPDASEWESELLDVYHHKVWSCGNCHANTLFDASKISCPMCGRTFPTLKMVLPSGSVDLSS